MVLQNSRREGLLALGIVTAALLTGCDSATPITLPYDHTHPVIYDNDSSEDTYSDELIMAARVAGRIDLRGMVTTVGGWHDPWDASDAIARHTVRARRELVAKAGRSGFPELPTPLAGVMDELVRPSSNRIGDTQPLRSDGAQLIVEEAKHASAAKPLVIVVGGAVSSVADAYLMAPSIKDRVVVAWNGGENWNGDAEPFRWATELVLRNFTCVIFDAVNDAAAPDVPQSLLQQLPRTELRQFMIEKELPHVNLPEQRDFDAPPILPLLTSGFVTKVRRFRWIGRDAKGLPKLEKDAAGNIWRVTSASRKEANRAWREVMLDPRVWKDGAPPARRPFQAEPAMIPGRIEAEKFDEGGPEIAYHDTSHKSWSDSKERSMADTRVLESVDLAPLPNEPSRYCVVSTQPGEWLAYTIKVKEPGLHRLTARVASPSGTGRFRIQMDDAPASIDFTIPQSESSNHWRTVEVGSIEIPPGFRSLRIQIIQGGFDLDWIEFMPAETAP